MSTYLEAAVQGLADQGFEEFLRDHVTFVRAEENFTRDLDQAAFTMHVRSRGVTVSDMVSNFGVRPETRGQWLQYDPNEDGEVHPINIVGPAVTTNRNACLQSNSETIIASANASALHKQIAMKWQRVGDMWERTGWDEAKRGFVFDDTQKGGTDLVEVFMEPAETQEVAEIAEKKTSLAVFMCPICNANGVTQAPEIEEREEDEEAIHTSEAGETPEEEGAEHQDLVKIPCPQCGEEADAQVYPLDKLQTEDKELQTYEICDRIIPSFNFVIDSYGAKIGGIQTAGWLRVHFLRDRMWMRTHYPAFNFGGPGRWSYQSMCDYALSRGRWTYVNRQPESSVTAGGHERYEEEQHYMHESQYEAYVSPEDYELVDIDGTVIFAIKRGQTIAEAQEELYGFNPHGFKFYWCQEQLLGIPSPKEEPINFRHRFSDVHWSRESGAYRSAPNYSIVYIQDDVTLINTLDHNITARNAAIPVFYDSTVFEESDFYKEFIGSKNSALLTPDFDVRKAISSLPIPTSTPYLMQRLQWLWEIKDTISLVTPAMRGESQQGSPYAAQRQQLEQSYGNLTAVLKSFAQCKCETFKNKARLAKEHWTLEQFQEAASMFGEVWSEEDVAQMCSIDIDRDLIVTYRQGSEIPSTPMGEEMRFFGALAQLLPFIEMAPQLLGQDKLSKILQKIDEFGNFDFDLTGLETSDLIAQKRYNDLAILCEPYGNMTPDQIEMLRTRVVGMEPATPEQMQQSIQIAQSAPTDPMAMQQAEQLAQGTPITALDAITEKIFHEAGIRFSHRENLPQQGSFLTDMLNSEIGKTKPNYMLIESLEAVLDALDEAISAAQSQAPPDPAAEAESAKLQIEAAKVQGDQELGKAKLQVEQMKIQAEMEKAAADRDQKDMHKAADLEHQGREAEAQRQQADKHKAVDAMSGFIGQAADHEHQAEQKTVDIAAKEKKAESKKK